MAIRSCVPSAAICTATIVSFHHAQGGHMFTWHALRLAAIARHRLWWRMFEDSDPAEWPKHMEMIRAVYGY